MLETTNLVIKQIYGPMIKFLVRKHTKKNTYDCVAKIMYSKHDAKPTVMLYCKAKATSKEINED